MAEITKEHLQRQINNLLAEKEQAIEVFNKASGAITALQHMMAMIDDSDSITTKELGEMLGAEVEEPQSIGS